MTDFNITTRTGTIFQSNGVGIDYHLFMVETDRDVYAVRVDADGVWSWSHNCVHVDTAPNVPETAALWRVAYDKAETLAANGGVYLT